MNIPIGIAYAQSTVNADAFGTAISPIITNIVNPIIAVLFAVALVVFIWSVAMMIIKGAESEERERFRWAVFGSLIGMFLMMSAWGIIYMISNTIKTI